MTQRVAAVAELIEASAGLRRGKRSILVAALLLWPGLAQAEAEDATACADAITRVILDEVVTHILDKLTITGVIAADGDVDVMLCVFKFIVAMRGSWQICIGDVLAPVQVAPIKL